MVLHLLETGPKKTIVDELLLQWKCQATCNEKSTLLDVLEPKKHCEWPSARHPSWEPSLRGALAPSDTLTAWRCLHSLAQKSFF